jgi:hypothetical protein
MRVFSDQDLKYLGQLLLKQRKELLYLLILNYILKKELMIEKEREKYRI